MGGVYAIADSLGVKILGGIYTHYHFDHAGGDVHPMFTGGKQVILSGAKEIEKRGGTIWAGAADADMIFKQCHLSHEVQAVSDGDAIDCGDLVLTMIHAPGHTPGSICIFAAPKALSPRGTLTEQSPLTEVSVNADQGLLVTGDSLFPGSCGRTDLPGSDQGEMFSSLARLSTLHPDVIVCPGHNYAPKPYTTIGAERANNQMVAMGLRSGKRPAPLPFTCLACSPCGPKDFVVGRKVLIGGLTSDVGKTLNGLTGVVEKFDGDKDRYAVRLLGPQGTSKALRPENLDFCPPCNSSQL